MSRLAMWGNSLSVRIPKNDAERAALKEGDDVSVFALECGDIRVRAKKPRKIPHGNNVAEGEAVREPTEKEVLAQW